MSTTKSITLASLGVGLYLAGCKKAPDPPPQTTAAMPAAASPEPVAELAAGEDAAWQQSKVPAANRLPEGVQTCALPMQWCKHHERWHDGACPENTERSCCEKRQVQGVVAPSGHATEQSKFCPECGLTCGLSCPITPEGKCSKCGKPVVEGKVVTVSWQWCAHHDQWHDKACEFQAEKSCCEPKKLTLPVCPTP